MPKFLCDFAVGNTERCLDIVEAEDKRTAERQLDLRIRAMVDLFSCEEISEQRAKELEASGKLRPYPFAPLKK